MESIYQQLVRIVQESRKAVLVTVIETEGSTPRKFGTKMIVQPDQHITGTIGGGSLEHLAIERATAVLEGAPAEILERSLVPDGSDDELVCGGKVRILIEPVTPDPIYQQICQLLQSRQSAVLVTAISGQPPRTQRWLYCPSTAEELPAELAELIDVCRAVSDTQRPSRRIVELPAGRSEVLCEPLMAPQLLILGAGHVGQALARISSHLDFRVTLCDPRPLAEADFPKVELICAPFAECCPRLVVGAQTYIVICTLGHRYDRKCLQWALQTKAGYIGMLGSRTKFQVLKQELQQAGFSAAALARVNCPVGLAIRAQTPAEIAVAIWAQIIQKHRS